MGNAPICLTQCEMNLSTRGFFHSGRRFHQWRTQLTPTCSQPPSILYNRTSSIIKFANLAPCYQISRMRVGTVFCLPVYTHPGPGKTVSAEWLHAASPSVQPSALSPSVTHSFSIIQLREWFYIPEYCSPTASGHHIYANASEIL